MDGGQPGQVGFYLAALTRDLPLPLKWAAVAGIPISQILLRLSPNLLFECAEMVYFSLLFFIQWKILIALKSLGLFADLFFVGCKGAPGLRIVKLPERQSGALMGNAYFPIDGQRDLQFLKGSFQSFVRRKGREKNY